MHERVDALLNCAIAAQRCTLPHSKFDVAVSVANEVQTCAAKHDTLALGVSTDCEAHTCFATAESVPVRGSEALADTWPLIIVSTAVSPFNGSVAGLVTQRCAAYAAMLDEAARTVVICCVPNITQLRLEFKGRVANAAKICGAAFAARELLSGSVARLTNAICELTDRSDDRGIVAVARNAIDAVAESVELHGNVARAGL